jgi:hypothetical protein
VQKTEVVPDPHVPKPVSVGCSAIEYELKNKSKIVKQEEEATANLEEQYITKVARWFIFHVPSRYQKAHSRQPAKKLQL